VKAKPVKLVEGEGYVACGVDEATHVAINVPGPSGRIYLPVMLHGQREGTGNWTWNGDTDKPTLRPSVLTTGHDYRCHSWINDGQAQFLSDCSHGMANQTVDLLEV
jgi:hypothetical protein